MSRHGVLAVLAAAALCAAAPIFATDPDRDFSGKWTLDRGSSRLQGLDTKVEPTLTIVQQEAAIQYFYQCELCAGWQRDQVPDRG